MDVRDVKRWLPGDKVRYTGATIEQIRWGDNDDPRDKLVVGGMYTLDDIDIHSYHTKIQLEGVEGRFNSVSFQWVGGEL